jgi:2-polyprenyl-6-methoxyphenol hydroxylase-like FAD-dependent oxidoreductase
MVMASYINGNRDWHISHGYPLLFFDRQWLLQILYNQLKHKDRVLLGKKVKKIEMNDRGVTVSTEDGENFKGDLIIGADGIHSAVRKEMFRIGNEAKPGYFRDDEEDQVPCYYQCSFGIAQDVENWTPNEQCFTTGYGKSFLVASGPENRVYWFLFVKLPEVKRGNDIPKYTKADEAQFVEEHQSLKITESLTFGEVYAKRLTSSLTPLHEVVFEKWFFDRVLLIGDSIHKVILN